MHYVCSDIHGRWDRYAAMLKGLNLGREDRLYILGDAIDRGEDGIRILLDIKDRKNVTFFLGNHEMFLLEVMGSGEEGWRGIWLFNGGSKTAADFMALDKGQQEGLLSFLQESLAVMPDLEVGQEHYYLVHAFPCLHYLEEPVRVCQLSSDQEQDHLYDMVWTRADRAGSAEMKTLDHLAGLGRKVIMGHTITKYFMERQLKEGEKPKIYHDQRFTCIDCGCAMAGDRGQLGVLRLEDGEEFYY